MRHNEDLSSVEKDPAGELLNKLDVNKPFGLNPQMHLQVHLQLRVVANVTVSPLLVISEKSWQIQGVHEDWKTANATVNSKQDGKKDHGKY